MLLELIQWQEQRISDLEDKIQDLKHETKKPRLESSKMDKKTNDKDSANKKRKKKQNLKVHDEKIIQPDDIPEGACFKGYRDMRELITPENWRRRRDSRYVAVHTLSKRAPSATRTLLHIFTFDIKDAKEGGSLSCFNICDKLKQ